MTVHDWCVGTHEAFGGGDSVLMRLHIHQMGGFGGRDRLLITRILLSLLLCLPLFFVHNTDSHPTDRSSHRELSPVFLPKLSDGPDGLVTESLDALDFGSQDTHVYAIDWV